MRRVFSLGAAVLLAGCSAGGGTGPAASSGSAAALPTAAWLAGTWVLLQPGLNFPEACESGLPIAYLPEGTYSMHEEQGRWRLRGYRIEETATAVDDEPERVGVTVRNRIRRAGPDEMLKTFQDGTTGTLRRCPPAG